GCLQAIIKYLKDYEQLKYSEIAKLINRDQRTVWNAYNQAKNTSVKINETTLYIPLSIIADRKENVLGSIILYLKDNGFSYKKIASLLQRNYQTIYTTYRKTRRKSNE
ncbi:MAG: hypothetical protein KKF65_06535, partial [Nanoarchaeota archaeon]|nr:hypothetical protein [Nanoarchaeota archaeon]